MTCNNNTPILQHIGFYGRRRWPWRCRMIIIASTTLLNLYAELSECSTKRKFRVCLKLWICVPHSSQSKCARCQCYNFRRFGRQRHCKNKKAELSQRWPLDAPYKWVPWKFLRVREYWVRPDEEQLYETVDRGQIICVAGQLYMCMMLMMLMFMYDIVTCTCMFARSNSGLNSLERACAEYALPKRNVLSCRQKDVAVSE